MELLNARRETVDAECEQVARQTSDVRRNHELHLVRTRTVSEQEQVARQTSDVRRNHALHLVRTRTASELVGADSVNENPRSITQ